MLVLNRSRGHAPTQRGSRPRTQQPSHPARTALTALAGTLTVALLMSACSESPEPAAPSADNDRQAVSGQVRVGSSEALRAQVEQLHEQFVNALPGSVIQLPEATLYLERGLSLTADNVTVRGAGMDKSVLSFRSQGQGAEGLLISGSNITLEDFAVEDTKGDGIKLNQGKNHIMRRLRVEWTNGPASTNGAYGLYPVQCDGVLIEHSVVKGASDAGIYVGQSKNIVVRHNHVENNVAGIEIENSQLADVVDNVATRNTGGILVFDLPNLPVQGGRATRVFNNKLIENNTENFAAAGNIVQGVPKGLGMMVNSNDNIEIFGNEFTGNSSAGLLIVSYHSSERPWEDPNYDPYPETIYVHDNRFEGGGFDADQRSMPRARTLQQLQLRFQKIPDIIWDGIVNPAKAKNGVLPKDLQLCLQNNIGAAFVNLDASNNSMGMSSDIAPYDCSHPRRGPIELARQ